jgi:hypothetical protein
MQHQKNDRIRRRHRSPIHPAGESGRTAIADSLEGAMARLFRRLGYRVHRRPATHDQGVDLILRLVP